MMTEAEDRPETKEETRLRLLAKHMAPKGSLGLPPLLDERRIEFGITNGAFTRQATFDRMLIWQIPMQKGEKFNDSSLFMPESTQMRERNKAPHGIIVSAGLKALDILISNGMGLGHKVLFAATAPYHVRYDVIEGREFHLIILVAGDIFGSEDLATNLRTRKVRIMQNPAQKDYPQHGLVDDNGKWLMPQDAWRAED